MSEFSWLRGGGLLRLRIQSCECVEEHGSVRVVLEAVCSKGGDLVSFVRDVFEAVTDVVDDRRNLEKTRDGRLKELLAEVLVVVEVGVLVCAKE